MQTNMKHLSFQIRNTLGTSDVLYSIVCIAWLFWVGLADQKCKSTGGFGLTHVSYDASEKLDINIYVFII